MGIPPRETKLMTMWEYMACMQGWQRSQGTASAPPMSDADYEALCRLGEAWNGDSGSRP